MSEEDFWAIVSAAHQEAPVSMEFKCENLGRSLGELSDLDLTAFAGHFDQAKARSYTWPLWGAAYVMDDGCSDDSFDDFRSSLISYGRERFEAALHDPDSLAEVLPDEAESLFYEGYQYVVAKEFERRGGSMPPSAAVPDEPSGEQWDEDTVEALYPRIVGAVSLTQTSNAPQPRELDGPRILKKFLRKTSLRIILWFGFAFGISSLSPESQLVWKIFWLFVGIATAWALFLAVLATIEVRQAKAEARSDTHGC